MFERLAPGEGELDLPARLAVVPPNRVYAVEVPARAAARAGLDTRKRVGRCVEATRWLLADAAAARAS